MYRLPENTNDIRNVNVFYTASLPQVVGAAYKAPNLALLASRWLRAKGTTFDSAIC